MRFLRPLFGRPLGQGGQSIIEAVISVIILGIAAQATALLVRTVVKQNVANRDRIFATEKALQMLEELRSQVLTENEPLTTLDTYNDGFCNTCTPAHVYYKYTLTTKAEVTSVTTDAYAASAPLSGNPLRPGGYAFVRYVDILSTTKDSNVRTIYVRVYAAANNLGTSSAAGTALPASPTAAPLAEVYGIVHSQQAVAVTSQVLDIYFVGLESVPGWWSRTSNMIPLMQSSVVALQAINQGLVVRSHWIQTMSYGRDLEYTPEINAEYSSATITASFAKTYVYPGWVDYDDGGTDNDYFYLPSWFLGRVNVAGAMPPGTNNGNSTNWPSDMSSPNWGYAIADQFNHAMRYEDEANLFQVLQTIAINNNKTPPQMSYRMLLEELNDNNPAVQNAIVINLHGEMVPVPPLRNYSDAAKDPDYFYANYPSAGLAGPRSYRVVTQPEQLWYNAATSVTQAVNVYAYDANPAEIANATGTGTGDDAPAEVVNYITLFIPGATTSNLYQVYRTQGDSEHPYYRFMYGTSGVNGAFQVSYPGGITTCADSLSNPTFQADNYTPNLRAVSGLRIRLYGTTPTARAYYGPEYSLTVSP